jgi:hypothetical protein
MSKSSSGERGIIAAAPLAPSSPAALSLAALIALIAWLAFGAQVDITVTRLLDRGMTIGDGLARLTSYLTNLTIFATAVCFSCIALRARSGLGHTLRRPPVVTAIVLYVVFVGLAYNLLLRYLWTPSGYRLFLNEALHTVVPLLAAIYWLGFVPRFHLTVRQCLLWLLFPLLYLGVTLWRGSRSDFYPYPFINVAELGYSHVLRNAGLLALGFVLLIGIFAVLNHLRKEVTT